LYGYANGTNVGAEDGEDHVVGGNDGLVVGVAEVGATVGLRVGVASKTTTWPVTAAEVKPAETRDAVKVPLVVALEMAVLTEDTLVAAVAVTVYTMLTPPDDCNARRCSRRALAVTLAMATLVFDTCSVAATVARNVC